MHVPQLLADDIRNRAQFLEVIQEFVSLKRDGKDYKGACPFCGEKHFSVSPAKEIYKCWSCDKGGNSTVTFLMESQKMDYPAALQWLADFYHIYIPQENGQNNGQKSSKQPGKAKTGKHQDQVKNTKRPGESNGSTAENAAGKINHIPGDYFSQTLQSLNLTRAKNRVKIKWLNRPAQSEVLPLLSEDKDGNIEFLVYDINGFIITYEKQNGTRHDVPYKVVRLKEPKLDSKGHMMKYYIPKGVGTRPFFPPNLLDKFQAKEKIHTLCLTEGYKKAISGWLNGLDIVGLTSISTYTDKQTMQLHHDIVELIIQCKVENVILLYDGDCRDISAKALEEKKDLYLRPNNFFSSARGIKELLKDYLKDYEISLYFAHINSDSVKGHPKGLDDLYEALINETFEDFHVETSNVYFKSRKFLQAKVQTDRLLNADLLSFSKPCHYFHRINISFSFQKLLSYLAIDHVNGFYTFHRELINDKQFIYNGTQYKYNRETNECDIIIPAAAKNYVRIGDEYYEKVKVPNKYKELELQLHHRSKVTITDDHGKTFINHISKFKAFCNVPDHVNYQYVYSNCYNMYNKFEFDPEPGDCNATLAFLQHIFEEHYELGLDYIQLLYQRPAQILPIVCLVSKKNNTGKTTFAKWLKAIFRQNMAIVGNADLQNDFNGFWSTKLIICCEEVFIDKKLLVERIKNLSTADRIIMNQKGQNQIEIEFFGHFILLTNNEDSFINISDDDIRYWVRKIKMPAQDNTNLLKEMIDEIPAFLSFLNQRQMTTQCESRMWFNPQLLITDALRRIQASSKSSVEKEIRERLKNMFIDFEENIIYMTIGDLRKEFFNNKYDERYIGGILRDNIGADMYWEPAGDQGKKAYKFKRYSFPKYNLIWTDGGKRQEIERTDIRGNGRPFVFLRPDFVPAEDEEGLEHNADMQLLANEVPKWYWKDGMLGK